MKQELIKIREDTQIRKNIETLLLKARKYVFKMPAPGSTVAAMMSGGLDTTVVIGLLLKKYKLNIIPFYFERYWPGDDNSKTLSAAQEIFSLYQREYPNQLEDLNILTSFFPSKEVVVDLEKIVWEEISAKKTKNVKGM